MFLYTRWSYEEDISAKHSKKIPETWIPGKDEYRRRKGGFKQEKKEGAV